MVYKKPIDINQLFLVNLLVKKRNLVQKRCYVLIKCKEIYGPKAGWMIFRKKPVEITCLRLP